MVEMQKDYVEDKTITEIFFKTSGRLNRKRYLKRRVVLGILLTMILSLGYRVMGYEYGQVTETAAIFNTVVSLIFIVPTYCLNVRRLHDMNRNNRFAIISAILSVILAFSDFTVADFIGQSFLSYIILTLAFFSLALSFYFVVSPGTNGKNRYGASPIPVK